MERSQYEELTGDLEIFVPTTDLALRILLPNTFNDQLVLEHAISPFTYTRKFLLMTNRGFRVKVLDGVCKEPKQAKTSEKRAMYKVVDMIKYATIDKEPPKEGYLARIRWRDLGSSQDTWMDTTRVNPSLMQEFYVGSIGSWRCSNLISKSSWHRHQTEEQLWMGQPYLKKWLNNRDCHVTGQGDRIASVHERNKAALKAAEEIHLRQQSQNIRGSPFEAQAITEQTSSDSQQHHLKETSEPTPHSDPLGQRWKSSRRSRSPQITPERQTNTPRRHRSRSRSPYQQRTDSTPPKYSTRERSKTRWSSPRSPPQLRKRGRPSSPSSRHGDSIPGVEGGCPRSLRQDDRRSLTPPRRSDVSSQRLKPSRWEPRGGQRDLPTRDHQQENSSNRNRERSPDRLARREYEQNRRARSLSTPRHEDDSRFHKQAKTNHHDSVQFRSPTPVNPAGCSPESSRTETSDNSNSISISPHRNATSGIREPPIADAERAKKSEKIPADIDDEAEVDDTAQISDIGEGPLFFSNSGEYDDLEVMIESPIAEEASPIVKKNGSCALATQDASFSEFSMFDEDSCENTDMSWSTYDATIVTTSSSTPQDSTQDYGHAAVENTLPRITVKVPKSPEVPAEAGASLTSDCSMGDTIMIKAKPQEEQSEIRSSRKVSPSTLHMAHKVAQPKLRINVDIEIPEIEIDCVCGATSQDSYIGEWIQCWTCWKCFHDTCVYESELPFKCANCTGKITALPSSDVLVQLWNCCRSNSAVQFSNLLESISPSLKKKFLSFFHLGCTGLGIAAECGSFQVLETILSNYSEEDFVAPVDHFQRNPFHLVVLHGRYSCLETILLMNPAWLNATDIFNMTPFQHALKKDAALALGMLAKYPIFEKLVHPVSGDTVAHFVCESLPSNFDAFLSIIPSSSLLGSFNKKKQTPVMVAAQQESFNPRHVASIQKVAGSSPLWWTVVDGKGYTVVHYALHRRHFWIANMVDLSLFRDERTFDGRPLLHFVAGLGYYGLVPRLLAAGHSVQKSDRKSNVWPILHAATAGTLLEFLRVDAAAQFEHIYDNRGAFKDKVKLILRWITSFTPLYNLVQEMALMDPTFFLTKCRFFLRFRRCLRVDVKVLQVALAMDSKRSRTLSNAVTPISGNPSFWSSLISEAPHLPELRSPFAIEVQCPQPTVYASDQKPMWVHLAMEMSRQLATLFNQSEAVFYALGQLMAHMVSMKQRLPCLIFPPGFLSNTPDYKPDLAASFRRGLSTNYQGLLEAWNGHELFLLLHEVRFPSPFHTWKDTVVYKSPFHIRHALIHCLWTIVDTELVEEERTILRFRWSQPITICPADYLGDVAKRVFGIPQNMTTRQFQIEFLMYVRGFQKAHPPSTSNQTAQDNS